MKSLRYILSKKTPHNMDDLIDYCSDKWFDNKPLPSKAVINVKAYKNQADLPITGTEYVFGADYRFLEKNREFVISEYVGSSKTSDLSECKERVAKSLKFLEILGIDCVLETPELENLLKK